MIDPLTKHTNPGALFSRDFVLVLLNQVTFGFCFFTFFLLPKYMTAELKATPSQIGTVSAAFGIAIVVGMLLVGQLIDRYGRKRFIILGTLLCALPAFGYVWVTDVGPLLYLLRICQGFAFAFTLNGAATLVTDMAPAGGLGKALGLFGASLMIANGAAPYVLEPVAGEYGWDRVFIIAALPGLASFGISLFIREKKKGSFSAAEQTRGKGFSYRRLLPVLFAVAACGAAFSILFNYYQPFALSLEIHTVRGFFVGYTISAIIARVFLGGVADRFGRRRIASFTLVFVGLSVIAMAWLRPGILPIIGAAFGLSQGLFIPALNAHTIEGVADRVRGRVMAIYNASFNVGYTAAVWTMGPVIELAGYPVVFVGTGLVVLAAVAVLVLTGSE
ncbi:MAG: MFS transporter [bacterium]|nr:MFS transporter [bacterium]